MSARPLGVGVIGAGDISRRYVNCLQALAPFEVRAVAGRSEVQALLDDPKVELVLNLTPPLEHVAVTAAALRAGKHVYSEKPLAHDLVAADGLIALARDAGRTLACAPAVHLGPAQQAVRRAIDTGALGRLVGGCATIVYAGPDRWHANPAPIFGAAAGPLFDLGVYFVSAFVHWFGSVRRVSACGRRMHDMRRVQAGPRQGEDFAVSSLTHVVGWIEFESGPIVSLTTSFDSPGSRASLIEVFGTDASLALAAGADGFTTLPTCCRRYGEWLPVDATLSEWSEPWWAIGVVDAADALRNGREPRCSTEVARHVLDVLTTLQASCESGGSIDVRSRCRPPAALAVGPVAASFPSLFAGS
jgi:predicted dehydrogenase